MPDTSFVGRRSTEDAGDSKDAVVEHLDVGLRAAELVDLERCDRQIPLEVLLHPRREVRIADRRGWNLQHPDIGPGKHGQQLGWFSDSHEFQASCRPPAEHATQRVDDHHQVVEMGVRSHVAEDGHAVTGPPGGPDIGVERLVELVGNHGDVSVQPRHPLRKRFGGHDHADCGTDEFPYQVTLHAGRERSPAGLEIQIQQVVVDRVDVGYRSSGEVRQQA